MVWLDVNDATTNSVLAGRFVNRQEWTTTYNYETFTVPFTIDSSRSGHRFEFRVSWLGYSYIKAEGCGLVNLQWPAESASLGHLIGHPSGSDWSVYSWDSAGWLQYGPYTTIPKSGAYLGLWSLMIDDVNSNNNLVVTLDVNDATTQTRIASVQVT